VARINVDDLKPGMVLGADVADASGRLLATAGTELTAKHLRVLRAWGVTEASVEGVEREEVEAQAVAELDPQAVAEAEAAAERRFAHNDRGHPAVAELHRVAVRRRARLLTDERHG
jgi:hypothetical protein